MTGCGWWVKVAWEGVEENITNLILSNNFTNSHRAGTQSSPKQQGLRGWSRGMLPSAQAGTNFALTCRGPSASRETLPYNNHLNTVTQRTSLVWTLAMIYITQTIYSSISRNRAGSLTPTPANTCLYYSRLMLRKVTLSEISD